MHGESFEPLLFDRGGFSCAVGSEECHSCLRVGVCLKNGIIEMDGELSWFIRMVELALASLGVHCSVNNRCPCRSL